MHFYNQRGTAEQWIKEGKYALNWTRLSCHRFVCNQVRLLLFVLAYNLGNFLRRLALPRGLKHWSLRSLQVTLIKMGGRMVRHARHILFQLAEVPYPGSVRPHPGPDQPIAAHACLVPLCGVHPVSERVVGACRHRHRGAGPKPPSFVDDWGWDPRNIAAPRGDRPTPSIPYPRANLQIDLPYGQRLHATAFRLGKSFGRNAFVKISDTCGTRGTLKTPRATSRVILIFSAEICPRPCFFP